MTPEERQLIAGLFDRMRGHSLPEKDRDAEALINEQVRATPDAPYMLVQSVLVQEHALQEAASRIEALEEQVRALEGGAQQPAPGSGSFLGGLFGGGRAASEPSRASVPQIGSRAAPSVYDSRQSWTPPPGATQQQPPPGAQAAPASGGFLRSAMATAAGVAGGVLAAGAIRNMLGGSSAQAAPAPAAGGDKPAESNKPAESDTASTEQPREEPQQEEPQQVVDEDSSWFGDDGDGDFEL
jgi:hypothetical protein